MLRNDDRRLDAIQDRSLSTIFSILGNRMVHLTRINQPNKALGHFDR